MAFPVPGFWGYRAQAADLGSSTWSLFLAGLARSHNDSQKASLIWAYDRIRLKIFEGSGVRGGLNKL